MASILPQILLEKHHFHPLTFLTFLIFTILVYKWKYTKNNQLPSPKKLPIIGNLHQLGKLPHRSLQSLSRVYGDLMLLHLGSKPALVVSSASSAEEIMKTHDTVFANRRTTEAGSIIFYNNKGIVFAKYGDYFRKMKGICVTHMLNNKKVKSFRKIREEEVNFMIEGIRKSGNSTAVDLTNPFTSYTYDVVSRVAFGRKYRAEDGCENISDLLNDLFGVLGEFCFGDSIPWLSWIDLVTGVLRKATRVAKAWDDFIEKIVNEHLDRVKSSSQVVDDGDEGNKAQDLVDVLLEIQRNDPSLERDGVKALLLDMLAGGVETTRTLLEWATSELLKHPRVMKQLQNEVRGFKKGEQALINEDDLNKMMYLKAVIKETLRLHPPLPLLLSREPSQNTKVNNYDIKSGTLVIINAWAIDRHPSLWEFPEEFYPERFLETSMDFNGKDFKFIPFGAGRRACPGISFASTRAELALANLVGEFDWELPSEMQGDSFMDESFGLTIHRRDPLMAIPTPFSQN